MIKEVIVKGNYVKVRTGDKINPLLERSVEGEIKDFRAVVKDGYKGHEYLYMRYSFEKNGEIIFHKENLPLYRCSGGLKIREVSIKKNILEMKIEGLEEPLFKKIEEGSIEGLRAVVKNGRKNEYLFVRYSYYHERKEKTISVQARINPPWAYLPPAMRGMIK